MRHLSSLKLARAVPDPDNDPSVFIVYRIFGCSQSKDVNLKDLAHPVLHRFAVINPQRMDDEVFEILEAAGDIGALAPVKLMDVGVKSLYLLLDAKVDSTIFAAIKSLWMAVTGANSHRNIAVHFACESEVLSGHSDYPYWCGAKEILQTEELGLIRDVLPSIPENDPSEGLRLRIGHDSYLSYSTMNISDIQSRPGCRDKNKKKPGPVSLRRKELEKYWALINERMLSESPYCQSKKRAIGENELETSKPKKKRHAKENPRATTFSEEGVAVARAKQDLRNAKLLR
ncbi:hypothetical protein [Pseudomonas umsongensis]